MSQTTFIYSLNDPKTNYVRYIGKANNVEKRFERHLKEAIKFKEGTHKIVWINSLLKILLKPTLTIIDEVLIDEYSFWEKHYISLYKSWGFDLTNGTEGGDGLVKPNNITREKMSSWQKGRKLPLEQIQKMKEGMLKSEKYKKFKIRMQSKEWKCNLREQRKKYIVSDETKLKQKIAWKTRKPMSEETIKRIADGNRERNKLRKYKKGYHLTAEHKRKISLWSKKKKQNLA